MKKLLIIISFMVCLLLSSCSNQSPLYHSESSANSSSSSESKPLSDDHSALSSEVLIPLGSISGKRPGAAVVLPTDFVCTQPLSNCYQSRTESDYFGITSITITLQDTRDPNEIILRYDTRSELGNASRYEILQGNRKITAYVIGEWDSTDTTRLLQPKDRYYRHVLEFEEDPYFVSFIYTVKGIENKEAEEQMLKIIETFRLESSIEEKVIYTFDVWSDFGIMAPTLFQQPEELTAEDLRELYTYYCASTCTPVYRWEKTSEQWKENGSYKQDSYVKVDELYSFGEKYFGMDDLSVADFPQTEDAVALNSNMVLLNYDDSSLQNKRPKNWLNDVYLLEGKEQDDRITLKLRYYYTRTTSMPELESLDCTVTAKWTENGPLFESCRITDTVPAALEPNFIRTEAQLPSEILSQVDPSHPSSIIDALYLGLEWEKQGYIVYQEDMVNYTLYTQITDAGSKEMGLPKEDVFTGYSYIPVLNCLADGNYKRPFEYYLLSYSTGKIVSLSEEENEVILRGTIEGKKELLQKIFE